VLRADPAHKLPNAIQYRRAEAAACWENVSAPVLLVAGEDSAFSDALSPLIDASPGARPFPNQQTATISGCGHMVHFEQPRRLAQAVERFVSSVT
jgi:pimeloyl-ACP methyl ester carboxylesterase